MNSVLEHLEDEIYKSLEYHRPDESGKKDSRAEANALTLEFLGKLPGIRELLQTDIEAAYNGDPAALSREGNYCGVSVHGNDRRCSGWRMNCI